MSLFFCMLADILHLLKILMFCDMFFSFRKRQIEHKAIFWAAVGIIMSGVSAFIYLYDNDDLELGVYILTLVIFFCLLYRGSRKRIVVTVLWIAWVCSLLDTTVGVLVEIAMSLLGIDGVLYINLSVAIVSLVLIYMIGRAYKKYAPIGMNSISVVNLFWFTFLICVDTAVVSVIAVMKVDLVLEEQRNIYLVTVAFVIIGIFIQLAAVILLFTQRNVYKEKKQLTEKYLNEQKNHYEYLEKRERETKKFRHDFRSHLELISNMAKNHEVDEIHSYLETLQIKIDELGNAVTVQNGIVDAILNQYYAKALQHGIKMEVKGRFPGDCEIDAYDICTIFSNILSNAIEAAAEAEEKYVSVECRYNERNIIIVVKNSFHSEPENGSPVLKTRKEDLDYHGYGLTNMKDSVDRYNGVFDIEVEEGRFTLTILFNSAGK